MDLIDMQVCGNMKREFNLVNVPIVTIYCRFKDTQHYACWRFIYEMEDLKRKYMNCSLARLVKCLVKTLDNILIKLSRKRKVK